MATHPDLLIVGGGIIGLTTAYFLAREGVKVEIVDKGDLGQEASWAGAGILPPGNPLRARAPFDRLRALSSVIFPVLSAELRERTGIDNGYLLCGGIDFVRHDDESVTKEWRSEGIDFELLEVKALHKLEPALTGWINIVYHLPQMAQVRNPRHLRALATACEALGVRFRRGCPVHGFDRHGDRILAVKTDSEPLVADRFLLATGAWTDPLLDQVGFRPGIRPVRGQIALLNTGTPLFRRILQQGKRYLVPRAEGLVLVGSTEEDAGFDKRTTAWAINDLLEFAISLVPALAHAHVERTWAGLRPGSPDGLPFLGSVPGYKNLFIAAGHHRAGLQLSPATAQLLKELLLGQPLTTALEPFRLDRVPGPTFRAAFRS